MSTGCQSNVLWFKFMKMDWTNTCIFFFHFKTPLKQQNIIPIKQQLHKTGMCSTSRPMSKAFLKDINHIRETSGFGHNRIIGIRLVFSR